MDFVHLAPNTPGQNIESGLEGEGQDGNSRKKKSRMDKPPEVLLEFKKNFLPIFPS